MEPKIRIDDDPELRSRLEAKVLSSGNKVLALWAMGLAEHVASSIEDSDSVGEAISLCSEVVDGFIDGSMDVGEIRRRGFAVHALARDSEGVEQAVIRTIGQALSVCHMRDHAMVASDYAVKVTNILYPGDMGAVSEERLWQLNYFDFI